MSLRDYFAALIQKVEESDINNGGKDKSGFYKPTRTVLLQNLNLLKDLHDKPRAKMMVKAAWAAVIEEVPAEWLVLTPNQKKELKEILR